MTVMYRGSNDYLKKVEQNLDKGEGNSNRN